MTRYHGYECFCDTCSEARNRATRRYAEVSKQPRRYGETYEEKVNRARKEAALVEQAYKRKS